MFHETFQIIQIRKRTPKAEVKAEVHLITVWVKKFRVTWWSGSHDNVFDPTFSLTYSELESRNGPGYIDYMDEMEGIFSQEF